MIFLSLLLTIANLSYAQQNSFGVLESLNGSLNVKSPLFPATPACTLNDPFVVKEKPKTYFCNFDSQSITNDPPKGILKISMYEDNDNKFLGLGLVLEDILDDGDDMGFTHGLGMSASYTEGKNEFTFDANSSLYTKNIRGTYKFGPSQNHYQYYYNGVPAGSFDQPSGTEEKEGWAVLKKDNGVYDESVRFIDVNRFVAGFKHGKDFYVKGTLGVEERKRSYTPNRFNASNQQNWWHGTLLHAYTFDYVDPSFHEQLVQPVHVVNGPAPVKDAPGYTVVTTSDYNSVLRPEIKEEKLQSKLSPYSLLASGTVGASKAIFNGHCVVNAEAGASLSTEKGQVIGQNSNVNATALVKYIFGKNKKKLPDGRFSMSSGAAVFYYPEKGAKSGKNFGQLYSMSLQSTHKISRYGRNAKNYIQPFLSMYIPVGKNLFDEFNDNDTYSRVGLRFIFK